MPSFDKMKDGYTNLYNSMKITREGPVMEAARKIISMRSVYEEAEQATGAPWWFIGALHMRECNNNMKGCLTNGEMIVGTNKKTRLDTKGRGPFPTWLSSAIDCAELEDWDKVTDWSIERCLYEGEKFNGWGYLGKGNSPYVWAGSSVYTRGKYVRDGVYSSTTVDPQLGIAPVMQAVLMITGARKIPDGSKGQWINQAGKFVGIGGGSAVAIGQQISGFLTDWRTLSAILVILVAGGLTFWWKEHKTLKEYKEGRYIPSGEAKKNAGWWSVSE